MAKEWLRTGGEGFLPDDIAALLGELNEFPIARWNFLVLEPGTENGSAFLSSTCRSLRAAFPQGYQFQCDLMSGDYKEAVLEWARDLPLREPAPEPDAALVQINTTLAKAALPIDPRLRQVLKKDPFSTYEQLLQRLEAQKPMKLHVKDDYLVEPGSGRTLVPMLLAHDPLDTASSLKVLQIVGDECARAKTCASVGFLGGHFASLENQQQIMKDLSHVSISGTLLTILALIVLRVTKLMKLLWLMVPVGLGTALAAASVVAGFGWIHGLTLSFGMGLVGLALDHGLHAAFQGPSKGVWQSNLMGLLTTIIVLIVVSFSQVPALRQLMIFSTLGLVLSFGFIYLQQRWRPQSMEVPALRVPKPKPRLVAAALALLAVAGVVGLFTVKLDLKMTQLGFMQPKTLELYEWFGQTAKSNHRFVIHPLEKAGAYPSLFEEKAWADNAGLRIENAASYLPPQAEQEKNRAGWFASDCAFAFEAALDPSAKKFFGSYLGDRPCERVRARNFDFPEPAAYTKHLRGPHGWISILYPRSDSDVALVKERFPKSFSLPEVAGKFPELFASELKWMTPVSLGLILALLLAYYRSAVFSLGALLPFLVGVGGVVVYLVLAGKSFNFLTMIALLMVCGLSVDYGVFAVDQWRRGVAMPERLESALLFCCLTTAMGVFPLVLARHPVLNSLGVPLLIGVIGALLGGVLLVPEALNLWARVRRA